VVYEGKFPQGIYLEVFVFTLSPVESVIECGSVLTR